jgi:hypothetical protein
MGDDAALRYYEHDGADPLPVVLESLRESGRDADRIEIDDRVSADELRAVFEAAGFEPVVWNEQEGAFAEIAQRRFTPTVDPTLVGLGRLMPGYEERMGNVGRNIAEGRLGLLQAVLRAV